MESADTPKITRRRMRIGLRFSTNKVEDDAPNIYKNVDDAKMVVNQILVKEGA
jgi:hypothetical protein